MKKQKRIRVEVVPGKVWDDVKYRCVPGWLVRVDGGAYFQSLRKNWAANAARGHAQYLGNVLGWQVELYLRRRDGTIGERSTFPISSDPRRSKG